MVVVLGDFIQKMEIRGWSCKTNYFQKQDPHCSSAKELETVDAKMFTRDSVVVVWTKIEALFMRPVYFFVANVKISNADYGQWL